MADFFSKLRLKSPAIYQKFHRDNHCNHIPLKEIRKAINYLPVRSDP